MEELARAEIGARDGQIYSPRLIERLGLSRGSGAVPVSLVHHNTLEEIQRFGRFLGEMKS